MCFEDYIYVVDLKDLDAFEEARSHPGGGSQARGQINYYLEMDF